MSSFIGIIYAFASAIMHHTTPGWTSITCIICFFGGIQLLSLGVISEYIGKRYLETKQRQRYIISERTGSPENKSKSVCENTQE